jgi:hypothetical protein
MPLPRLRLRYADVAATLALILATGGTAYAATKLPAHSVGTAQLKNAAVTDTKLHGAAVTRRTLAKNAVNGAAVAPDSLSLADLVGTDVSGFILFNLAAGTCSNFTINVPGAKVGQAVLFSFTGTSGPPTGVIAGAARVQAAGTLQLPVCNETGSPVTVTDAGVRIVTFG